MSALRTESAQEFADAVDAYAKRTLQLIARGVMGKIFVEVSSTILQNTPVLTGHARHNWRASIGAPSTVEIVGVAGVTETGAALTGTESSDLQDLADQFAQTSGVDQLCLANNVPYIQALDDGSSQKAPSGIVLPSITATLALLQDRGLTALIKDSGVKP